MKRTKHLLRDVGRVWSRGFVAALLFSAGAMNPIFAQGDVECTADAGTLSTDLISVCLPDGGAMIHAAEGGDAIVPVGYSTVYVLTKDEELVIVASNTDPEFTVEELGLFTIHTLVYDPLTLDLTLIDYGITTGADVNALLIQGGGTICASLDLTGASIMVDDPDAGGLTAVELEVCLEDSMAMIHATADGDIEVPVGYSVVYVLTMGDSLVITQTGSEPHFIVGMPGMYTIHTLVYDPATLDLSIVVPGITTGADVHALLVQGGGSICASLDLGGAVVHVIDCDGMCMAQAGGLVATDATVCLEDSMAVIGASPTGGIMVPEGYTTLYVLTTGAGMVISDLSETPDFTVSAEGMYRIHTLVYDSTTLDLSTLVLGVSTGSDVHALLMQGGGDICGAIDLEGALVHVEICDDMCMADAGSVTANAGQVCLEDAMAMIGATEAMGTMVPDGYTTRYVLTMGGDLVIQQVSASPDFTVDMAGMYTIHTLVYDPMTLDLSIVVPGVTTGADVHALLVQGGGEICAALDLVGAGVSVIVCDDECMADAGSLSANAGQVCLEGSMAMIGASEAMGTMVPEGYTTTYVLTMGGDLVIQQVSATPDFTVDMTGMYTIHTLVYDPMTLDLSIVVPGVTTGADVNALLVQGGGEICAALDVMGASVSVIICDDECTASAGSLMPLKDVFCLIGTGSVIGATVVGDAVVPPGYQIKWIATHGEDLIIEAIGEMAWFSVDGMGMYTIHTLVYDPATLDLSSIQLGVTSAYDVNAMLIQGGGSICASLDVSGVSMIVDSPITPTLSATAGMVCLTDGSAMVSATAGDDMHLPVGYTYQYILTMGDGMVIQEISSTPSFEVSALGHYTIHTLVYDPATFPLEMFTPGVSTAHDVNDILVQGGGIYCAALDIIGASVHVITCDDECAAWAGSLMPLKDIFCYIETGSVIGATVVGDAVVPPGYQIKWVATYGDDMIIEAFGDMAWFSVSGMGLYTIHTLVYDPMTLDLSTIQLGVTSAYDVHALLTQGGGAICASLDLGGVSMIVDDPTPPTLTAIEDTVCLSGGMAMIGVTSGTDMNLPMGYTFQYVLTQGPSMVIMEVSDTPSFEVSAMGSYTIHTLLYDPFTFPLEQFTPGVHTAHDINAILVQGGGIYCAALDMSGADIQVIDCGGVVCLADAGTLSPDDFETCLDDGDVTITATGNADMVVPAGYLVKYALTMGPESTIMYVGDDLSFTVTTPGTYTFHTLVYDPATLDLSIVVPGTTTAAEVNALLIQGGGAICASLDITGGSTLVIDCSIDCMADAGMLIPDTMGECLSDGTATIVAIVNEAPMVPAGYSVTYVLTKGLTPVVYAVGPGPEFVVTSEDIYRIHTLVYDPTTLDLSTLTLGVTTAMEVNALLIQGGGDICASLDIYGALFTVVDCADCLAFAGTLTADTVEVCLSDSLAWLNATIVGDDIVPEGFTTLYVLTYGPSYTIVDVSATPDIWVDMEGAYTIHTLVYDPLTLDLGMVVIGETSALDVLAFIEANQDVICASLDLTGITFTVVDCTDGGDLVITNAWPVPAIDQLTVELNVPVNTPTEMMVFDMYGAQVMPGRSIAAGTNQIVLNVAQLGSGQYVIRMLSTDGVATYNFSKAR